MDNPVLAVYVDHSALQAYFNDELVYTKGTKNSRMRGYGDLYIDLPDNYAGMNVRLEYNETGRNLMIRPVFLMLSYLIIIHSGEKFLLCSLRFIQTSPNDCSENCCIPLHQR